MTGQNSNVFYETGFAHAKNKSCVLLTQNANDIPFDLKHHHHIVYEGKILELKSRLTEQLRWLKGEVEKRKSEVFSVRLIKSSGLLVKEEWRAVGELDLAIDVHNGGQVRSPEIEAIYLHTGSGWTFLQEGKECSFHSEENARNMRHFLMSPVTRLSPGAWAPLKLLGKKTFWDKFKGTELKE